MNVSFTVVVVGLVHFRARLDEGVDHLDFLVLASEVEGSLEEVGPVGGVDVGSPLEEHVEEREAAHLALGDDSVEESAPALVPPVQRGRPAHQVEQAQVRSLVEEDVEKVPLLLPFGPPLPQQLEQQSGLSHLQRPLQQVLPSKLKVGVRFHRQQELGQLHVGVLDGTVQRGLVPSQMRHQRVGAGSLEDQHLHQPQIHAHVFAQQKKRRFLGLLVRLVHIRSPKNELQNPIRKNEMKFQIKKSTNWRDAGDAFGREQVYSREESISCWYLL